MLRRFVTVALAAVSLFPAAASQAAESADFAARVAAAHCQDDSCARGLKTLLQSMPAITRNIGHENADDLRGPNNSWHPATRTACAAKVLRTGLIQPNAQYQRKCGAKWMAPVPPRGKTTDSAKVCIDQFEFPNVPCEYPIVWVSVSQAQRLCRSMGKRLCNAFEWEGGCAGSIDMTAPYQSQRAQHNSAREQTWAFNWIQGLTGLRDSRGECGVYSVNDPEIDPAARSNYTAIGTSRGCDPGTSPTRTCGSNTWPSGFKHRCVSSLGVYDMHGNVAEVVSLPTGPNDIADASGRVGVNEHKGSFFVYRAQYPDDCRVRQPPEHQFPINRDVGHAFYQEGFRCCKDVE